MRPIKRYCHEIINNVRLRGRVAEIKTDLQKHFALPSPPTFKRRGLHGRDNIYIVSHNHQILGVLRLHNPFKKYMGPPGRPYVVLADARERMDREWTAYTKGAAAGLTPRALWRTHDALLSEYLPYPPLQSLIEKNPDHAWTIIERAAPAIQKLHAAGLTHMDSCLQNMLGAENGAVWFIDFEYAPAAGISPEAQRAYDHLRLLERAWKFIPEKEKSAFGPWLDLVVNYVGDEAQKINFSLLTPSLPRITSVPGLGDKLRQIFQ